MSGRSPVTANGDQRAALSALAVSRDRREADRARAVLLTLSGWTSPRIAEAFGVREDTVRLWRVDFARGGVEDLKPRNVVHSLGVTGISKWLRNKGVWPGQAYKNIHRPQVKTMR